MPLLDPSKVAELIDAARSVFGEFPLGYDFTAGGCAAAILAADGRIYTGICLDLSCGIGFCAEHAAVAEMLKARQTQVLAVVAVGGEHVVPPCGRCRELLAQIDPRNLDAAVILSPDRTMPLRELLPNHWLGEHGT